MIRNRLIYLGIALSFLLCGACDAKQPSVSLNGGWLYFIPTFNDPTYAVKGDFEVDALVDVELVNVDQEFKSGFRIEALTCIPCMPDLDFRFTYFGQSLKNDTVAPDNAINLSPSFGLPSFFQEIEDNARIVGLKEAFSYQSIDAFAVLYSSCNPCLSFNVMGGFTWARLAFNEDLFAFAFENVAPNSFKYFGNSVVNGYGPQIACSCNWALSRCFALSSRLQLGTLIRSLKNTLEGTLVRLNVPQFSTKKIRTNPKHFWSVCLNADWNIGFVFNSLGSLPGLKYFRLPLQVEAGYEWLGITKYMNRLYFVDPVLAEVYLNELSPFTLQGPYVKVNFSF